MLVGSGYDRETVIILLAKIAYLVLADINTNNKIKISNFKRVILIQIRR